MILKIVSLNIIVFISILGFSCSSSNPDFYDQGTREYNEGKYQTAIETYSKAIDLDPNDALSYYGRAKAKSMLNRDLSAINDYTIALAINSDLGEAYLGRGISELLTEQYNLSLKDLEKARDYLPNDEALYFSMAYDKSKLNDLKGALEGYNKAAQLKPGDKKIYINRGNVKLILMTILERLTISQLHL